MDSTIIGAVITALGAIIAAIIGVVQKKNILYCVSVFLVVLACILFFYKGGTEQEPTGKDNADSSVKESVIIINGDGNTIGNNNEIKNESDVKVEVGLTNNQGKNIAASPEPDQETSKYPNPPGDELIDIYGPGLHYPDKTEYLDECITMYVDAPKGYSIYAYSSHRKDKRQIDEIRDGEEVTVLAVNKNNGFSCVIVESSQKAVWVNSAYLSMKAD